MADLLMLAVVAGFFALCVGYIALCDRILGPDADVLESDTIDVESAPSTTIEVAA